MNLFGKTEPFNSDLFSLQELICQQQQLASSFILLQTPHTTDDDNYADSKK